MFIIKQVLKGLLLPPMPWILLLVLALIFWQRRWARKLLLAATVLIVLLHSQHFVRLLRYPLESRYAALTDPQAAEPYDAIVVLMGGTVPAGGLIPFPAVAGSTFQRLNEAWRLYRLHPKPVIVTGGHVDPFTPPRNENQIGLARHV
jgi:uncharacterized SAM-binding protein YcdF (DUF218 family)